MVNRIGDKHLGNYRARDLDLLARTSSFDGTFFAVVRKMETLFAPCSQPTDGSSDALRRHAVRRRRANVCHADLRTVDFPTLSESTFIWLRAKFDESYVPGDCESRNGSA